MKRKIISILLALSMLFSAAVVNAVDFSKDNAISLLGALNIMNGYPDGTFGEDKLVTRAEFTKTAVAASEYRNTVATNLKVSPFSDVSYKHWSAPYILAGVNNGLIRGYENSAFRPDQNVAYEEALTVCLRLLGYTDDDFGSSWPYGQLGIAQKIGICDNVNAQLGEALTRAQVATLVSNVLKTNSRGANSDYIEKLDYKLVENIILIATQKEDNSVAGNKVMTSDGIYKITSDFDMSNVGRRGDALIVNGDTISSFMPSSQTVITYKVTDKIGSDLVLDGKVLDLSENMTAYYKSQTSTYSKIYSSADEGDTLKLFKDENGYAEYTLLLPTGGVSFDDPGELEVSLEKHIVYSVLDSGLITYTNGKLTSLTVNNSTTVYDDGSTSTFSAIKSKIEMGDTVYVKRGSNNNIDYINYSEGTLDGPVVVRDSNWANSFGADISTLKIMKEGSQVSSLNTYDVVYYSKEMNTAFAYAKKITGVYKSASPNKDSLTSVQISNTSYEIETTEAFSALSSDGEYSFGDTVTVLLGKNDKIAGVLDSFAIQQTNYGYLIDSGKTTYTNEKGEEYSSYYIKVVLTDGEVYEYAAKKDYSSYINKIVKVSFADSEAGLWVHSSSYSVSGKILASNRTIGDYKVASDAKILDISTQEQNRSGLYTSVFLQRLDGVSLRSDKVLYCAFNSANEISELILNDVTGDMYEYGVVKQRNNDDGKQNLIVVGEGEKNLGNTKYSTLGAGQGAKLTPDGNSYYSAVGLNRIDAVKAITAKTLKTSTREYILAEDITVYKKVEATNEYLTMPLNEVIDNNNYTYYGYYDKEATQGGRVRVIVAFEK